MTQLILPTQTYLDDVDNPVVVRHDQAITDDLLDLNKEMREAPTKEFNQVASIPVIIVEKWMREGFNIFDPNITAREIIARLLREDLSAFITTNKSI